MNKKTIIIGAGPAGLSCGYKLSQREIEVEVFESTPYIGGMCRSFDLWGQRVDLGPHRFFSKQKDINNFFSSLIQDDFTLVCRQTRIYYQNNFFDYPLKLSNVLKNLSLSTIIQILWYYMRQRFYPIKDQKNFEQWVSQRFGKKLYSIFFKHYTEKLWGIPCTQIDADWAAQRIKTLTLAGAVKAAILTDKKNKHKTLVDRFAYPKNGTGTLYEKAATAIREKNGKLHLSSPVKRVLLNNTQSAVTGVQLQDNTMLYAENVISTMPITKMIKGFDNVPEKVHKAVDSLYFRNTILVYLEIDKEHLFTDNWLYIHSPEVKHGRITNFRNWCPSMNKGHKTTILCLEFWCFDNESIWTKTNNKIIHLAKEELYTLQIIPRDAKILNATVERVSKCYPVYETGYKNNMDIIIDYLRGIKGLQAIGRYGAFKYNNQDHSILMGLLAADNIVEEKNIDLWAINTDTEYQEEGKINNVLIQ